MAHDPPDPYWKLRPIPATPDEEVCHCPPGSPVMLRSSFTDNPLYCVACNGEVAPEHIGFDENFADRIASWLSVSDSLYRLWLDSGEYEEWAAARLSDPQGGVNHTGREIVADLNQYVPSYYWWFQDVGIDGYEPPERCPNCRGHLEDYGERNFQVCHTCRILI